MNDMPTLVEEAIRKARKEHSCCECLKTIPPGEEYLQISGKWETGFQTFKQCLRCSGAFKKAMAMLPDLGLQADEGPGLGGLDDWISDFAEGDGLKDEGLLS